MSNFNTYRSGYGGGLSPIFKTILIINILVWLLQLLSQGSMLDVVFRNLFYLMPYNDGSALTEIGGFWPWQLITYQFMHSTSDFLHLFFNMYILWMFGSELEHTWGGKKFLAVYLLSGIGAGVLHLFVSSAPVVGASGAVMGTFIAYAVLYPEREIFIFPLFIPIKIMYVAGFYVIFDFVSGWFNSGSGVAHWAHVGGALTGFLLVKIGINNRVMRVTESFFSLFSKKQSYNNNKFDTPSNVHKMQYSATAAKSYSRYEEPKPTIRSYNIDGEEINQTKIDEILDKISASGYQNLTEREKNILIELSKKVK